MYDIVLKHGNDAHQTTGYSGLYGTSPRDLQKLAAVLWGNGAQFEVSAPLIGMYHRDIARS